LPSNLRYLSLLSFPLQDILKQANDDGLTTAKELPYFDGDFWPNALEDSIKELDQEEEERQTALREAAESADKEVRANRPNENRKFLVKLSYFIAFLPF